MLSEIIIAGDATVSYVLILVLVDHALGVIKDDNELSFTKKS